MLLAATPKNELKINRAPVAQNSDRAKLVTVRSSSDSFCDSLRCPGAGRDGPRRLADAVGPRALQREVERDLANALERVTRYVAERSAETPKVEPLRADPAQSPRNRPSSEGRRAKRAAASARNPEWRRAESNRGPRDYETLALAN